MYLGMTDTSIITSSEYERKYPRNRTTERPCTNPLQEAVAAENWAQM